MLWKVRERILGPWPKGPVIWLHGASLGECGVLWALALRLYQDIPECPTILLTTQKKEVAEYLEKKVALGISARPIYVRVAPLPLNVVVKRFYKQVNPLCLVLCENELWPAYLFAEKSRPKGARLSLVSGRFRQGALLPRKILSPEAFAFADFQTEKDKIRFNKRCEFPKALVSGNWKLFQKKPYKSSLEKKIDVAFLSLHYGELKFLKGLFLNMARSNKAFLVAPRRLENLPRFKSFFKKLGIEYTAYPEVSFGKVCFVEQFGLFSKILPLVESAVVGGSFKSRPGIHDFREPLLFGVKTYVGPYSYGQEDMVSRYFKGGILQKLPLRPCSLPNNFATSEEIIKFLEEELKTIENSYSKLLEKLSIWIKEK